MGPVYGGVWMTVPWGLSMLFPPSTVAFFRRPVHRLAGRVWHRVSSGPCFRHTLAPLTVAVERFHAAETEGASTIMSRRKKDRGEKVEGG